MITVLWKESQRTHVHHIHVAPIQAPNIISISWSMRVATTYRMRNDDVNIIESWNRTSSSLCMCRERANTHTVWQAYVRCSLPHFGLPCSHLYRICGYSGFVSFTNIFRRLVFFLHFAHFLFYFRVVVVVAIAANWLCLAVINRFISYFSLFISFNVCSIANSRVAGVYTAQCAMQFEFVSSYLNISIGWSNHCFSHDHLV